MLRTKTAKVLHLYRAPDRTLGRPAYTVRILKGLILYPPWCTLTSTAYTAVRRILSDQFQQTKCSSLRPVKFVLCLNKKNGTQCIAHTSPKVVDVAKNVIIIKQTTNNFSSHAQYDHVHTQPQPQHKP